MQKQSKGLTRRGLFQTFAGGALLAGLPGRSFAQQACAGSDGPAVLWNKTIEGYLNPSSVLFQRGSMWGMAGANLNGVPQQLLTQFDVQSGAQQGTPKEYPVVPRVDNILMPINGSDALLFRMALPGTSASYVIGPDPRNLMTCVYAQGDLGPPILLGSCMVLCGIPFGSSEVTSIIAYDLDAQAQIWTTPLNNSITKARFATGPAGQVFVAVDGSVMAVNGRTGAIQWTAAFTGIPKGVCVSGSLVFVSTSVGTILGFDVGTGAAAWAWPPADKPLTTSLSAPYSYCNGIYCMDSGGNFYALNTSTQEQEWKTGLGFPIDGAPLYIEDGYAYLSTRTSDTQQSSATIFAIDLTSSGNKTLSYCTDQSGTVIGVDNGVCYLSNKNSANLCALDFVDQFHQFYCDSTLLADSVQGDPSNPVPSTPLYRTHVQLLDTNSNPRINKAVRIWASDTIDVTINGKTFTIGPNVSASTASDFAGEVSITVEATDVSCPTLFLWSDFMDTNEAMMVYPDHYVVQKLSAVTGSEMATATSYDGQTILTDPDSASAAASTIVSTLGNTGGVMELTRTRMTTARRSVGESRRRRRHRHRRHASLGVTASPNDYIAFSPTNLVYNADVTMNGGTRTYAGGPVPNFTTELDPVTGKWSFRADAPAAAEAKLRAATMGLDFDRFVSNVVKGARKVVKLVVTTAENVAHEITDDLGNIYQITVTALEHALAVVSGFLKSVVKDIVKAVEWLSEIFNWGKILAAKEQLKQTAKSNLTAFADQAATMTPAFRSSVDAAIGSAITAIQGGLGSLDSYFNRSMKSAQPNDNDPTPIYNANGKQSYPQSRWGTSKVTDNAANATDDSSSLSTASTPIPSDFLPAVDSLAGAVEAQLAGDLKALVQDLESFFSNFGNLLKDPSKFVTNSITDIFNLMGDLLVGMLKLLRAVLDSLIDNLPALLRGAIAILDMPIRIPVVDQLWEVISHDQLTMLDLLSLVIAIPSAIITDLIPSSTLAAKAPRSAAGDFTDLIGIGTILTGMVNSVIDGWGDLSDASGNGGVAKAAGALSLLGLGLGIPVGSTDPFVYVYWSMAVLPMILAAANYAKAKETDQAVAKAWSRTVSRLNGGYGAAMLVMSAVGAILNHQNFLGPDGQIVMANVFSSIPYVGKTAAVGEPFSPGRVAAGITDGVCDATSGIINGLLKLGA
ncbi:PQQ-binding-like beta-propeller repeat protein [uncultured Paludibaculum sp.]|uniref:outer membrane protein assembly factor BamB family protein n=1 Tax=uncultured Paludibaculum sp. TaxID=1765020 RepID=UPI002AABEC11|nr:PQQ-binding-like beta-propeller repeat protein [uncultured Paludibaculum sp.]